MNARLPFEVRDEIILGVFRDEAFAFFIVIDSSLSQPYVRPLEFIELVVSIAGIPELDARPGALYFGEECFVAVSITLHSNTLILIKVLTFYCILMSKTCLKAQSNRTRARIA